MTREKRPLIEVDSSEDELDEVDGQENVSIGSGSDEEVGSSPSPAQMTPAARLEAEMVTAEQRKKTRKPAARRLVAQPKKRKQKKN